MNALRALLSYGSKEALSALSARSSKRRARSLPCRRIHVCSHIHLTCRSSPGVHERLNRAGRWIGTTEQCARSLRKRSCEGHTKTSDPPPPREDEHEQEAALHCLCITTNSVHMRSASDDLHAIQIASCTSYNHELKPSF